MAPTLGDWVKSELQRLYPDNAGKVNAPRNWEKFASHLIKARPHQAKAIQEAVDRLKLEAWVHHFYLDHGFTKRRFKGWEELTDFIIKQKPKKSVEIKAVIDRLQKPGSKFSFPDPAMVLANRTAEHREKSQREMGRTPSQGGQNQLTGRGGGVQLQHINANTAPFKDTLPGAMPDSSTVKSTATSAPPARHTNTQNDANSSVHSRTAYATPATGVNGNVKRSGVAPASDRLAAFNVQTSRRETASKSVLKTESDFSEDEASSDYSSGTIDNVTREFDSVLLDYLLGDDAKEEDDSNTPDRGIQHAPIVSQNILEDNTSILPQYGLLGSHVASGTRIFQNTNVPFASFICGVQGSGKSHTTSCLLENALIPVSSKEFGRLEMPLSAMVFAYDDFNSDGSGFNVSEAASLASAHSQVPKHMRVKRVTVLVSPSNPVIRRIYSEVPNVTVIPFKLNPRTLTVKTILTLMAVDEASAVPLYLAQLTKILRDINVENNGYFDYKAFKARLKQCEFNPAQENMLQLRLDLLESFLDLDGNAPQPQFRPGEVTIMDMSCPFVDENTACILFKIGLDRYLQSEVSGKMVVLDEAHKYMLNVPGAKALNKELIKTIRLQRHKGVRIVIATQEPTLLTDLIALCDVTVIHRFSSPAWFSALKKHIPMANQEHDHLLEEIEGLKPGTALVYSPKAIFARDEHGTLVKGAGKLVKIKVRKRITADGGQSVMAI